MFQGFKNIFRIKPKKFLGIDIGSSVIRVVEIEGRSKERRLDNYGEFRESFFKNQSFRVSKKNVLTLSNKNIAGAINSVLEETGILTKEVNFSIPDFYSFFTSFELPIMDKKEISGAVRYQARPFIPLPLDEINLDDLQSEDFSFTPCKPQKYKYATEP